MENKALGKYLELRTGTVVQMCNKAVEDGTIEVVSAKADLDTSKGQIKFSDLHDSLVRIGAKGMDTEASTGQFKGQKVGDIKLAYIAQKLSENADKNEVLATIIAVATKDAVDTYKYLIENFQLVSDDLSAELYVQRKQALDGYFN